MREPGCAVEGLSLLLAGAMLRRQRAAKTGVGDDRRLEARQSCAARTSSSLRASQSRILLAASRRPPSASPPARGAVRPTVGRCVCDAYPDLSGEHDAGQALRQHQPHIQRGTLGRKTSDSTVRPGAGLTGLSPCRWDELDRDDRQRQCGLHVTSSRGGDVVGPEQIVASVAAG